MPWNHKGDAYCVPGVDINTQTPLQTITYTYGDTNWKDKLTAYNGKTITYDAIGNPLTYDGKSFSWLGRRLMTYNSGSAVTNYTYNADGIRTSKTVGGTKTEFFLNGSTVLAQKTGSTVMPFYYDANGTRIAFKYNGTMYYYVYNLQGDVTHIMKSDGSIVGTYEYDAWGKIINLSSLTTIARVNPFRYRGYYYDNESGLYYLNSRYYNPEWGRFINADGIVITYDSICNLNLFAYCGNNPINREDSTGLFFTELRSFIKKVNHSLQPIWTPSVVYDSTVTGITAAMESLSKTLELTIKTAQKPSNIGAGTFAKQCKYELKLVSKFNKISSNILKVLSYGAIVIDVGMGICDNIENGSSLKKTVSDALVDTLISGGSMWVAGSIGGKIGALVGSFCPVAGTVVGYCAGFAFGIGLGYVTDIVSINGHSARFWLKKKVGDLW